MICLRAIAPPILDFPAQVFNNAQMFVFLMIVPFLIYCYLKVKRRKYVGAHQTSISYSDFDYLNKDVLGLHRNTEMIIPSSDHTDSSFLKITRRSAFLIVLITICILLFRETIYKNL